MEVVLLLYIETPVYCKIPVYVLTCVYVPSHHLIFTMCEPVLKEKTISLIWNYFGFQAGENVKPIKSEKAIYSIASVCGKKLVLAWVGNTSNLLIRYI